MSYADKMVEARREAIAEVDAVVEARLNGPEIPTLLVQHQNGWLVD